MKSLLSILFISSFCLAAEPSTQGSQKPLIVNLSEFAPCVNVDGDKVTGFDIDLWEAIAKELNLSYKYQVVDFGEIIPNVSSGKADIGISGITIDEDREKQVNFSQHYLDSGLRVLIPQGKSKEAMQWKSLAKFRFIKFFVDSFVKPEVVELLMAYTIFIIFFAHLIWVAERGSEHFDKKYIPGLGKAIYFSVVTSSTVGFGDVVAKKKVGRAIVIMLILLGYGFFANLIARLAADFTSDRLNGAITCQSDLNGKEVYTVENTTSVSALKKIGAKVKTVKTIEEAYKKLVNGDIEIVVYDSPNVMYFANGDGSGKVMALDWMFDLQYYGFAIHDSDLRKKVDIALLKLRGNGVYDVIYNRWFGRK